MVNETSQAQWFILQAFQAVIDFQMNNSGSIAKTILHPILARMSVHQVIYNIEIA